MEDKKVLKALNELSVLIPDSNKAARDYLDKLIDEVKTDIAIALGKSVGQGDEVKSMKALLKRAGKKDKRFDKLLVPTKGDYYLLTNGAFGIRLRESYGFPVSTEQKSLADTVQEAAHCPKTAISIKLDNRAHIKYLIDEWGAMPSTDRPAQPMYDLGDGRPKVDASLLYEIEPLFPNLTGYIDPDKKELSPIWFRFEKKEGVLLPIRTKI